MTAHNVVAVVPQDLVPKLLADGWVPGRQNSFTATMLMRFPDATAAMRAGRKLKLVWAVEPA